MNYVMLLLSITKKEEVIQMIDNERIRQRKSYLMFKEWFAFLNTNPENKAILRKLYTTLDNKYAFHSKTQSTYAQESLDLLLEDNEHQD